MSVYAIGDVQGCWTTLQRLLRRIDFSPGADTVVLVGDLVNRGPDSLRVLRWAKEHEGHVRLVLGNHDLSLLAVLHGLRPPRRTDTFGQVQAADDCTELRTWLQGQPLMLRVAEHLVVHAGLLPQWTAEAAQGLADEVQAVLRSPGAAALLGSLSADVPAAWDPRLTGLPRWRLVSKALTYLRVCSAQGDAFYDFTEGVNQVPAGIMPWFAVPERQSAATPIVCGHWSALGLHRGHNVTAIDTGCVWGGCLTALRLGDGVVVQEPTDPADVAPSLLVS